MLRRQEIEKAYRATVEMFGCMLPSGFVVLVCPYWFWGIRSWEGPEALKKLLIVVLGALFLIGLLAISGAVVETCAYRWFWDDWLVNGSIACVIALIVGLVLVSASLSSLEFLEQGFLEALILPSCSASVKLAILDWAWTAWYILLVAGGVLLCLFACLRRKLAINDEKGGETTNNIGSD